MLFGNEIRLKLIISKIFFVRETRHLRDCSKHIFTMPKQLNMTLWSSYSVLL